MRATCLARRPGISSKTTASSMDILRREWTNEQILGKFYEPKVRHRMPPVLTKPRLFNNHLSVYNSLPFTELTPVEEPRAPPGLVKMMTDRHKIALVMGDEDATHKVSNRNGQRTPRNTTAVLISNYKTSKKSALTKNSS